MIEKLFLMLLKRLTTAALYERVVLLVVDDGLGLLVKRTDNQLDDKLHSMVVDALRTRPPD